MTRERKCFFWHSAAMARGDPTTYIKLPADLKEMLESSSHENRRSLTAEIVHILSSHFARIAEDNARYQEGSAQEEAVGVSIGLRDPLDRAAVLKVLQLSELMLLQRRVKDIGGRDAVLSADKADLVKKIEGPAIKGSDKEQKSYFSAHVANTPLTAILTNEEMDKIAARIVELQRATSK